MEKSVEFAVPQPMKERPDYSVSENPTVDELRKTAVRAMRDMVTIQWCTDKEIRYNKIGAVSGKNYYHDPNEIYCGLPYADGQTNLFVWLEHYDKATGLVTFDGDGQWFNAKLGNTCAGSLMWGWSAVCNSLTGNYINYNMVMKYGCIPVGDYKYDTSITSYKEQHTRDICDANGMDVMFESYAKIQMADAITSSKTLHTMMSVIDAVVVRDADGKIDGENSYIVVQDQAAGKGPKFREEEVDGKIHHFSGKTGYHATFNWLWEKAYIPCTTVELAGLKPYEKAWVNFAGACVCMEQLITGMFQSNYPMCLLKVEATDENGKKTRLHTMYFHRRHVGGGVARSYRICDADEEAFKATLENLAPGSYTVTAEVTASTGEVFTPVKFEYNK